MLETLLSLPIVLAATALVVELARLMAVLFVLELGLVDTAETLALRWIALEREGLVRQGAPSNASDLDPVLHAALTDALLTQVGHFPGFAPLRNPSSGRARGRLYVDLREGGELRLEARVCVPLSFLPWAPSRSEGRQTTERNTERDCQGRFLSFSGGPALVLSAETAVPLPVSYHVHARGLALPASIPLASEPPPGGTVFSREPSRPRWSALFFDAAQLYAPRTGTKERQDAAKTPVAKER